MSGHTTIVNKSLSFTFNNSATYVPESNFSHAAFRYVLIPGGVQAATVKAAFDYTKLSYEEICELFDIPE